MSASNDISSWKDQFTQKQNQRNLRIFQITGIDFTVLVVPVIVIVWLEAGLAFHEMLLLQGLFSLPIILFEVISGSIADYWSRKKSIAIFHLLFGIAMYMYAIGDSFLMFALAEIIAGVGVTLQTGSASALVYDSLLVHNPNPNGFFGKLVAKRMTILFLSSAIGTVVSGWVGSVILLRLPIFLAFLGHIVFIGLVLWGYNEPPRLKPSTPKVAIVTAVKSLKKANLQPIVLFGLVYMVFGRVGFWAVQHILIEDFLIDAFEMGIILAVFNGTAAISSLLIRSRVTTLSHGFVFTLMLATETGYLAVLIFQPAGLGMVLLASCFTQVTRGIRTPILQTVIQGNLQSDERATFISLISFTGSFLYFTFSAVTDWVSLSRISTLWGGFFGSTALTLAFVVLALRNNKKIDQNLPKGHAV